VYTLIGDVSFEPSLALSEVNPRDSSLATVPIGPRATGQRWHDRSSRPCGVTAVTRDTGDRPLATLLAVTKVQKADDWSARHSRDSGGNVLPGCTDGYSGRWEPPQSPNRELTPNRDLPCNRAVL